MQTLTEVLELMKAYADKRAIEIKLILYLDGSGYVSDTSPYDRELFDFDSLTELIDKLNS